MYRAIVVPETVLARWRDIVLCLRDNLDADGARILRDRQEHADVVVQAGDQASERYAQASQDPGLLHADDADNPAGSYLGLPILWPDGSRFGSLEAVCARPGAFGGKHEALAQQLRGALEDQLALLAIDRLDSASLSAARQESEAALRDSERRFRLLVENALDDFFMHDDKGRFLDVNARACRNLGYTREELLRMSAADVSKDLTQAQKEQLYRTTEPGASAIVYANHIRKDGSTFPVEVLISCHMIGGRKLFLGMVRDISDRVDARKALEQLNAELEERVAARTRELHETTERLQSVMDNAAEAICLTDAQGRYLLFNRAAEAILGIPANEALGRTAQQVYGADLGEKIAAHHRQVLRSGKASMVQETIRTGSGDRVLFSARSPRRDKDGRIIGLVAISRDVTERKLAEDALRIERERMMLAAEVGGLGVMDYQLDAHTLVCTEEWARIFGLTTAQATADAMKQRVHPDDRELVKTQLALIAQGQGRPQIHFRIHPGPGQIRWVSAAARLVPATSYSSARLICVISDVTERHMAQTRLKESYESLQQAERLARIGSWTLNLETGIFSSSDMLYEMNGMSPDSTLTPADLRKMMPPEDFARVTVAIDHCIRTGEPYGVDVAHFHPDGSRFAAHIRGQAIRDASGRIVALSGTVQDVSEREAARAQMAAIADSLPNGAIYRIDYLAPELGLAGDEVAPEDIRLSYISAGIEALIGVPADALMQDPSLLVRAIHEDDLAHYLETSREATRTRSVFDCEFRLIRPDASTIWLQVRSAPRASGNGRVWDGIILDVTREHETAEALRQAKEDAEAAERAKAEFLATMSHEIRTPMNSVIGMTRLALQTPLSQKQRNYLEKIDTSAKVLLGIINDILDFSRIEAGGLDLEHTDIQLETVLESVSNATSLRAGEKGLEVVYAVAPQVPRQVKGDPLRLSQILINLVGNAVKFTHAGEIVVSVDALPASDLHPQPLLRFSVRDTGIGMEEAQIANLFRPFSQADSRISRQYGGTGLGLSISKRLVALMGGDIWVESQPGQGSCFYFTVALHHPASRPRPMAQGFQGKRVLIVDDVASARDSLSDMATLFGIEAASVSSGAQAIDALHAAARTHRPFDLVLMDWRMPEMDGIETARRIRADQSLLYTPAVLMVTAYGREEVLRHADMQEFQGLLIKPVTESMLFNAVQHVFSAHDAQSIPPDDAPAGADARPAVSATDDWLRILRDKHILLVDDNAFNLEVASDFLSLADMRVDTAANGQEALDRLEAGRYDAVLMDLHMPHMDGLEATRRIRANPAHATLPIIALTAQARVEDRDATLGIGMTAHLTKPIDERLLYATLARVLEATVPVSAPALPDPAPAQAEGLVDLSQALRRLHGDQARFARLLTGFLRDFDGSAEALQAALDAGDLQATAEIAHKIKGAAGYLSAHALTALADQVERAARNAQPASLEADGARMVAQLRAVLDAVRQATEARHDTGLQAPSPQARQACAAEPAAIQNLIDRIAPLLSAGDYAAAGLLDALADMTDDPAALAQLEHTQLLFEDMDLSGARQALSALAGMLKGPES